MYSFLYSIKIGGLVSTRELLFDLIESILLNSSNNNYEIQLHVDENINVNLKNYISNLNLKNIKIFNYKNLSWYQYYINSFKESKNFTYLALIHDDVKFESNNFDYHIHNSVKNIPNVGCISLFDNSYLYGLFIPQFRGGFYIDVVRDNCQSKGIFAEYRKQKPNWHVRNLRLKKFIKLSRLSFNISDKLFGNLFIDFNKMDFPKTAIRIHSCFNNCIILKTDNIRYLKSLADFQIASGLLSDEDMCLEFMNNDLVNIYLPNIKYLHQKSYLVGTRSFSYIQSVEKKCKDIFYNKWKFCWFDDLEETVLKEKQLKIIKDLYNPNLLWSTQFYSWEYNKFKI